MDLAADITAEDIEVFLQETDEQLQALDEDIVRLEHEKDNPELLQEIFRISHTLKGSAAMFGHQQMTGLAHAMESLFDQVRKGSIEVSTQVIDALLHSLDLLLVMKNDLANSEDSEIDIASAVEELEAATSDAQEISSAGAEPQTVVLTLDQTARQRMQTAKIAGLNVFQVHVDLEPGTAWASVRCFQVLQGLGLVGDIISSQPTAEDVEAERVGSSIKVLLSTEYDVDTVRNPLTVLEDVASVVVEDYDPDAAATPAETAPETRAAEALDCRLVYALVPRRPLEGLAEERARLLAERRIQSTRHSMALEAQSIDEADDEEQIRQLAKRLLERSGSALWEDQ